MLEKLGNIETSLMEIRDNFSRAENAFDEIEKIEDLELRLDTLKVLAMGDIEIYKKIKKLEKILKEIKEEIDFKKYEDKINFMLSIQETKDKLYGMSIVNLNLRVLELFKYINFNLDDLSPLLRNTLVYSKNTEKKEERLNFKLSNSREVLVRESRKLLDSLYDFAVESFKVDRPFDVYDKLMILNILETLVYYLQDIQ